MAEGFDLAAERAALEARLTALATLEERLAAVAAVLRDEPELCELFRGRSFLAVVGGGSDHTGRPRKAEAVLRVLLVGILAEGGNAPRTATDLWEAVNARSDRPYVAASVLTALREGTDRFERVGGTGKAHDPYVYKATPDGLAEYVRTTGRDDPVPAVA